MTRRIEGVLIRPAVIRLLLLSVLSTCLLQGQDRSDWPVFGGEPGNSKYSPLTQINKSNVIKLQIVWTWKTGERPIPDKGIAPGRFEVTPLMIDDVLYISTPFNRVVALDANNGKEIWSYDPHAYERPGRLTFMHRGVVTWTDGKQRRVFMNTRGRLAALDAKSGKLIPEFGREGIADLTKDLTWEFDKNTFENTSPPVVYGNFVIVGSTVWDGYADKYSMPGDIQAFDVRTGKRVWIFHTIPQKGEFGNETWEDGSWQYTGHANAWVPFTVDEQRGLVYLPISTPANDHYGGGRKGNNLFGDSLVCLDAKTGKRVWHFQTVHHGLWDYDGVVTPNLVTIHVNGKTIDAVAAPSKTGFVYVFDRVTGEPVWPIEERPVPQTDVPGEKTSPTQPFPTKPPPFANQGFTPDDVVDFTPEIKALATEKLKGYRFGPIFNPPSLEGTIMMPRNGGGANWGGASVDPETGIMYVKGFNQLGVIKLVKADPNAGPEEGAYGATREGPYWYTFPYNLTVSGGLLLNKPPYSLVSAIDLNKGEILWQTPVGDVPQLRDHPLVKQLKLSPMGGLGNEGSVVTRSGLLFIGVGDTKLYAVDKTSGKVLWAGDLPFPSSGSPVTFQTRSGRQFVVVATGGGANATLVAFALPNA